MGNDLMPAGSDPGHSMHIEDGTLARIPSPTPGVIGLDAKDGSAKGTQAGMADRIVGFARQQRGRRVGDGQCFALADRALSAAGAKSASDFGRITPDADYVWGTAVTFSDLQAGDIIQFRDYVADVETVTETPDATNTRTEQYTRPHHTAIVEQVGADGIVTVLEQNAPDGTPATRTRLFFTSGSFSSGDTTTTVRVRGTLWYYRPQAR